MKHIIMSSLPAMLFCGLVILVYYLYMRLWLSWLISRIRRKNSRGILKSRVAVILHCLVFAGTLCIGYACFVEPYWPQVHIVEISTDKLTATNFRMVQISDLHCDKKVRLEERLPELVNALKPDAIVFTGDALNTAEAVGLFQATLARMEAPLGKYAVTGNWDDGYWASLDLFADTGFQELAFEKGVLEKNGESIVIAGIAYEDGANAWRIVDQLQDDCFNVLLYHTSSLVSFLDKSAVDLYLCGHTHGGQVALPFYGALTTLSEDGKKYEAGMYRVGHIRLYVNRGIGMEGGRAPRVRFWARPEITVFDIGPKNE